MSIVARGSAEAPVLMQTRKDKVEDLTTRQGVWAAQKMQGSQSPVEAVEAQMLGEPVLELIFALGRVSAERESVLAGASADARCRGSGHSERACRQRGAFHLACCCRRQRAQGRRPVTCCEEIV